MAQKPFAIRLITPAGKLMDGQATYASIPAHDGLIGFEADRAPIVFKLGLGQLRIDFAEAAKAGGVGGGSRTYLVEDGFAQMVANKLTVLTTKAWAADELVESDAAAELQTAKSSRDKDRARAKLALARSAAGKGI